MTQLKAGGDAALKLVLQFALTMVSEIGRRYCACCQISETMF